MKPISVAQGNWTRIDTARDTDFDMSSSLYITGNILSVFPEGMICGKTYGI